VTSSNLRLAVIQPILSPIRRPLWEIIAAAPGVDLKVFVLTRTLPRRRDWDVHAEEKFDVEIIGAMKQAVSGKVPGGRADRDMRLLAPRLARHVAAWKPDALLCTNISEFVTLFPLRFTHGIPIGVSVADTPHTASCYRALRQRIRAFLYRRMDFHAAYGSEAKKYLESIGIAGHGVRHSMWSVDNSLYARGAYRRGKPADARTRWISVGALIPLKGFAELLEAWRSQSPEFLASNQLVVVGEGPEEARLRKFIDDELPPESAVLAGYRTPQELIPLYKESDVFIFPTLKDTWGLVVNEAMASGLPVVCSRYAGCHSDLVQSSNGVVIDPMQPDSLAREIDEFWKRRERWEQMGKASTEIISDFTLEATASSIIEAAQEAVDRTGRVQ
jgi:glycosyltransferase involved in cell wall biosynthesis